MTNFLNNKVHSCVNSKLYGDWTIDNVAYQVHLNDLYQYLTDDRLINIKFEDIGYKLYNKSQLFNSKYLHCDINYPGIVAENVDNPYNKKYRLIDGNHRLFKMVSNNIYNANFYCISKSELYKHLIRI